MTQNQLPVKDVNPHYVLIKPESVKELAALKMTQEQIEKEMKKQNVGVVLKMGKSCDDWICDGDRVSFFRAAAATITIEGEDYAIVHEDHIMVKF